MNTPRFFRTLRLPLVLASLGLMTACAQAPLNVTPVSRIGGRPGDTEQRLADGALQSGSLDMAQSLYQKMLEKDPNSPDALAGMGEALFQSNELQRAQLTFEQLARVVPNSDVAEIGLARVAIRQHDLDQAIAHYQIVLKRSPDDLRAMTGLGVAYDLQGHYKLAQQTYTQGLMMHPEDLGLRNDLGLSLILSRQYRAGIAELMKIVDTPSAPAQTKQNLALGYGLLGNTDAAERVLKMELPEAQVQRNLQFYQTVRERLANSAAQSNKEVRP
ncbi:tetratricopeptide repeat protein [Paludibacterium purpuratum]|uniref:Tetratricopeptide repeat protein n=1 Tax=Paludibacterium purpuratum TaxID=1144873 RepID=A0A4R7B6F1_9NEIS|nr:tetratricopeptide repeat protein [Paludibacterium purpuratum]TDR80241.1 tetratricopeptide repeat protein [Paludibacterium purpuratum]